MKKIFYTFTTAAVTLLAVASCSPSLDDFHPVQTATADFSKFIAVGNTHTAGYADGGLQRDGQLVAFPNLIAAQMQHVGGGSFLSPLFSESQANGSGRVLFTGFDQHGLPEVREATENLAHRNTLLGTFFTNYEGPEYHNYGMPGMPVPLAASALFGNLNPYFERLLSGTVTLTSYRGFTTDRDHTFFLFWMGVDDVLGYAMNGAVPQLLGGGLSDFDPTTILTSANIFNNQYNSFIEQMVSADQKGVIATIPDVTLLPFFNTVTYAQIRAGIAREPAGAIFASRPLFIQTSTGVRPATPEDLFVLPVGQLRIGFPIHRPLGLGESNPFPRNMVLEPAERQQIRDRINQYNTTIRAAAEAHDLALVDMHEFVQQLSTGRHVQNGIPLNTNFIEGNMFSLDGLHFTPLGNAVVANLFIDAINSKYHASIPRVDITQYPGVRMAN